MSTPIRDPVDQRFLTPTFDFTQDAFFGRWAGSLVRLVILSAAIHQMIFTSFSSIVFAVRIPRHPIKMPARHSVPKLFSKTPACDSASRTRRFLHELVASPPSFRPTYRAVLTTRLKILQVGQVQDVGLIFMSAIASR